MSRWQVSDASVRRIQDRVEKRLADDYPKHTRPWDALIEAVKAEDYGSPRTVAEEILLHWIRGGVLPHFCANAVSDLCYERKELREAGQSLMKGIRSMGRMKL